MTKFDELVEVPLSGVGIYEQIWWPRIKRPASMDDLHPGYKSGRGQVCIDGALMAAWAVEPNAAVWVEESSVQVMSYE